MSSAHAATTCCMRRCCCLPARRRFTFGGSDALGAAAAAEAAGCRRAGAAPWLLLERQLVALANECGVPASRGVLVWLLAASDAVPRRGVAVEDGAALLGAPPERFVLMLRSAGIPELRGSSSRAALGEAMPDPALLPPALTLPAALASALAAACSAPGGSGGVGGFAGGAGGMTAAMAAVQSDGPLWPEPCARTHT